MSTCRFAVSPGPAECGRLCSCPRLFLRNPTRSPGLRASALTSGSRCENQLLVPSQWLPVAQWDPGSTLKQVIL
ncbi:hypothetical protein EYF80_067493 [Liparis tanakae]|uniref:Uncharacterized protein n=1 Tax=Liparis tanakae TaxID=230148 RepID=A0A4Z2E0V0_9TELE|nr:hypothetical protein EYF80_067493 [Liparis tanakae]